MPYGMRTRSGRYTRSGNRYNTRRSTAMGASRRRLRPVAARARRAIGPRLRMGRMRRVQVRRRRTL